MNPVLRQLESEAIQIIREVAGAFENPVILYSIGKDSGAILHLASKAFYPGKIPFKLLHIDTGWKFKEMISFRDRITDIYDVQLIVHKNTQGEKANVSPVETDAQEYTRIMKTDALKAALDLYKFDAAIGGARRDEERSRAKERVFSLREPGHIWNPKNQRPELWNTFNTIINPGQSMRVFPLSDWTEIDVWKYTKDQNIPYVPLYLSASRKVVNRQGSLIMVDDHRLPIMDHEVVEDKNIRFRSLGCYPLSAAIQSTAQSIDDIIAELELSTNSERAGRLIDGDRSASMESKKIEGYF